MVKKKKITRMGMVFLVVVFFAFWKVAFPAWADKGATSGGERQPPVQRVYDQAGLFTMEEADSLEDEVQALREQTGMDFILVTTQDTKGKASEEYADDFYDQGGFGAGKGLDGVLYLMDMDNREVYLSTSGEMVRVLTDARVEAILDVAVRFMGRQDYDGCAKQMLEMTRQYWKKGVPDGQYNYNRETGAVSRYHAIRWYEAIFAVALAAFCAGGVCWGVIREYGMDRGQKNVSGYYLGYRANAGYRFHQESDRLANSFVTQQIIPRPSRAAGCSRPSGGHRSTTHRSGSGRKHGGGGRRF